MTTQVDSAVDCTVLALYAIDTSTEVAARFYNSVLFWLRSNGHPPNRISVHGPGFSGKPVAFPSVNSRLQRQGFQDVTGLFVVSMSPGGEIPVRDWLLNVDWSRDECFAVIAARGSIVPFRSEGFRRYAEELVRMLRPEYGIAYHMPHRLAPDMYALGIQQQLGEILTGEAYEQSRNVAQWGDLGMEQMVWRAGVIRDVYPWNFLTAPQLEAKVDGCSLRDWISLDAQRGSLSQVSDTVVLWDVPEASIPTIRPVLQEAHIIFHWKHFQ